MCSQWGAGRVPCGTTSNIGEKTMEKIDNEELLMWVVEYHYRESGDGIGHCEAYIAVRDEADKMKYTYDRLTHEDKKTLMCALIDKVGYACEDYADDFDDPDGSFGFRCVWDDERAAIHFEACFRV